MKPDPAPKAAAPAMQADYDTQLENYTIVTGTPKTVIPKIRHVLETLRPGTDVIPAVKEMAKELDLPSSFEVDTQTGEKIDQLPAAIEAGGGGD